MQEKIKKLSLLLEDRPDSWGLRGHPYLWEDFKNNLETIDWSASENELKNILEELFEKLTGVPLSHDDHIFIEKYCHGGMSGGYIDVPYWRDNHIPMILKRFILQNIEDQMSQYVKDTINGPNFTIYLGDVDLKKSIVTIQKEMTLVAALQDRGDGKLLTSIYQPLCEKATNSLTNLSINPDEDGNVCMRPNNWEYALDCSASTGNIYASDRGEAYLSYWEFGLGVLSDGKVVPEWANQIGAVPLTKDQTNIEAFANIRNKSSKG